MYTLHTNTVVLVKHMNDNDLRNPSFGDDYKRLIAAAYPGPKKDIRAAVMTQIAEEAEQSDKKAKIRTKGYMNRFVRFGSMAACLVLLAALGFRVLPMMMKDAVVEDAANMSEAAPTSAVEDFEYTADSAPQETIPETAAASDEGTDGITGFFKARTNSGKPIQEEIMEEPAVRVETYSDVTAAEVPDEVVVEEAAVEEEIAEEVVEEAPVEEGAAAAPVPEEAIPAPEEIPADKLELPQAGEILMPESVSAEGITEEVTEEAAAEEAVVEEAVTEEAAPQSDSAPLMTMLTGGLYSSGQASAAATVPKSLSYTSEGCLHSGVFGNSFHDIPQAVANLVTTHADTASVAVWCSENAGTCGMNIYELLNTFSVPRESFETLYSSSDLWYHHDYNIDLLYGGDSSAAYEYYLNGGSYAEFVKRYFEYELKLDLFAEAGSKAYNTWAAEHGYNAFCKWSIAEFVRDFGLSRERFTELYDALVTAFAAAYPGYAVVEYDLDKLYEMGTEITDSIARGDMGYVTDTLYHK